ncbi:hypothetical protein BDN67DRAFT_962472 [Paxillus ammoniavirescens]|nr:hypothetical protein BDN67DRAFT_962472 [Paxillus ammoniavirescens]
MYFNRRGLAPSETCPVTCPFCTPTALPFRVLANTERPTILISTPITEQYCRVLIHDTFGYLATSIHNLILVEADIYCQVRKHVIVRFLNELCLESFDFLP